MSFFPDNLMQFRHEPLAQLSEGSFQPKRVGHVLRGLEAPGRNYFSVEGPNHPLVRRQASIEPTKDTPLSGSEMTRTL